MSRQARTPRRGGPGSGSQMRSRLQHHREMALDSLRRLWRAPLSTLMTVTVIAIALLLPALLAIVMKNITGLGSGIDKFQCKIDANPYQTCVSGDPLGPPFAPLADPRCGMLASAACLRLEANGSIQ